MEWEWVAVLSMVVTVGITDYENWAGLQEVKELSVWIFRGRTLQIEGMASLKILKNMPSVF